MYKIEPHTCSVFISIYFRLCLNEYVTYRLAIRYRLICNLYNMFDKCVCWYVCSIWLVGYFYERARFTGIIARISHRMHAIIHALVDIFTIWWKILIWRKSNESSSYTCVCIRACSVITLLKISIHNSYVLRTCQFISLKIEFKKYFRFVSDSVNVVGFTVYFLIIYITYTHTLPQAYLCNPVLLSYMHIFYLTLHVTSPVYKYIYIYYLHNRTNTLCIKLNNLLFWLQVIKLNLLSNSNIYGMSYFIRKLHIVW